MAFPTEAEILKVAQRDAHRAKEITIVDTKTVGDSVMVAVVRFTNAAMPGIADEDYISTRFYCFKDGDTEMASYSGIVS